jgi:hypothetical protein
MRYFDRLEERRRLDDKKHRLALARGRPLRCWSGDACTTQAPVQGVWCASTAYNRVAPALTSCCAIGAVSRAYRRGVGSPRCRRVLLIPRIAGPQVMQKKPA